MARAAAPSPFIVPKLQVDGRGSVWAAGTKAGRVASSAIPEQPAKASAGALESIRPVTVMLERLQLGDMRTSVLLSGLGESVRSIDLTRNILTPASVPTLSRLTGLRRLVLRDNAGLAMDDGAALAAAVKDMKDLKTFDISGCRLSDKASAAVCLALSTMWMDADASAGLCLRLGFCGIGDTGAAALGDLLSKGRGISELSLRGSNLGEKGARSIAAGLGGAGASLRVLDLGSNPCMGGAATEVIAGLAACSRLESLSLSSCSLGSPAMAALAAALCEAGRAGATAAASGPAASASSSSSSSSAAAAASSSSGGDPEGAGPLRRLRLSANPIGPAGVSALRPFLADPCSSGLEELYADGCDLADAGAAALSAECLPQHPRLAVLDLTLNGIRATGVRALAARMRSSASLAALSLARNKFGPRALPDVTAAAAACPSLTALDISTTGLTEAASAPLAALVESATSLTALRITKNDLKGGTAAALASKLRGAGAAGPRLAELDLGFNTLRDAGAIALCHLIRRGGPLRSLRLAGCSIGAKGVADLTAAVKAASAAGTASVRAVDVHRAKDTPAEALAALGEACAEAAAAAADGWAPYTWPFDAEPLPAAVSAVEEAEDEEDSDGATSEGAAAAGEMTPPAACRQSSSMP